MNIPEPNVWREPVRGTYLPATDVALPGIERMRRFLRPDGPRPPVCHLTGLSFVDVGAGLTTSVMPATGWLMAATGGFTGGVLAMAADGALGGALTTVLEPGMLLTTSELSVSYLRPATPSAGRLIARGRLVHAARTLGLSSVFIEDSQGKLLAHGSSRCVFVPAPPDFEIAHPEREPVTSPDPYLRSPAGRTVETTFATTSYEELFEGWISDRLPAPPLCHLTGLRPTEHGPGRSTWVLPASEWLNNVYGVVYGGAVALAADSAIGGAIWRTMQRGQVLASLNLHVYFLRPVFADGRDLVAKGRVIHSGRTLRVASAEVIDANGKMVATATGSAKVLSDRAPSLVDL